MNTNYLNIDDREIDIPVYRIFSLKRFEELIINSKLTLVRPELWEDPFENFLFTYYKQKHKGIDRTLKWYGSDLFGQCWTTRDEADELWRIYSPNKTGIKVKTTIQQLFECLKESDFKWLATSFIGKVEYLPNKEIIRRIQNNYFENQDIYSPVAEFRAKALLLKRKEFTYEKEVRIIQEVSGQSRIRSGNLVDIDFDFNKVIDSISVDPRLNDYEFNLTKSKLKRLGLKVPVYQSQLYRLKF